VNHTFRRCVVRVSIVACAAVALACESEGAGRCGPYTDTPGTGRITAVEAPPPGEYSCSNDPVRIAWEFTPDDPALAARAGTAYVTYGAGANPPRAAVAACGLTVGSVHPAVRKDEHGGACPPVLFELADLGSTECQAALATCFRAQAP
jgi:hypothetical protein